MHLKKCGGVRPVMLADRDLRVLTAVIRSSQTTWRNADHAEAVGLCRPTS